MNNDFIYGIRLICLNILYTQTFLLIFCAVISHWSALNLRQAEYYGGYGTWIRHTSLMWHVDIRLSCTRLALWKEFDGYCWLSVWVYVWLVNSLWHDDAIWSHILSRPRCLNTDICQNARQYTLISIWLTYMAILQGHVKFTQYLDLMIQSNIPFRLEFHQCLVILNMNTTFTRL